MPDQAKPTIRIIHHLARTGGTVLSKCLASMAGVTLLSEIHPLGPALVARSDPTYAQIYSPIQQARAWHGLLTDQEVDRLGSIPGGASFAQVIESIATRAREQGSALVVRDWSHLDFTGIPFETHPPYRLRTIEALKGLPLKQACTVRHPIHQWLSYRRLPGVSGRITLGEFARGARLFAENAAAIGFVRYEDFCAEPASQLRWLCQALALDYDDAWRLRWSSYAKITGDDRAIRRSTEIAPPAPVDLPAPVLAAFEDNSDYQHILSILGYRHPDPTGVS